MKKLITVVAAVAFAGTAFATDFLWKAAQDGTFGTAANWSPEGVPGAGDTVLFNAAGSYRVLEDSQDRTIGAASVTNADVVVDLGGRSWTVAGPWLTYNRTADSESTSTTISNGTLAVQDGNASDSSGFVISLKDTRTTKGNLRITGENTYVTAGAIWMGGSSGSFTLDGGAKCDVAGMVRWGAWSDGGSQNTVAIQGTGTRFRQTVANVSNVGNIIGDGCKTYFTDGASVYFASQYHLSGQNGGRWNELWITNGASVVFGAGLQVCAERNGRQNLNVCTIAGEDTRVTITGRLDIAMTAITNLLHITDHAVVTQTINGSAYLFCGYYGDSANLGCGNELRVDDGAEFHIAPTPTATSCNMNVGGGVYSSGNRIFVGSDSLFEIAQPNGGGFVGWNGAHDNGIVVSNGTFNVATGWTLAFGTSSNVSTPGGSGNYVEFYGDHPIAYVGNLTFNTGSKLIYHVDADGYAAAPMNFRYKAFNKSDTPAQLVLDVANWHPECKTTIPLAVTMRNADISDNAVLLRELAANATITGTAHPELYSVAISDDNKTLLLRGRPHKGFIVMFR